ncbi:hypothetical protein HL42_6211 [Trichophyton rubrum]|nr:hypothetical protein HL42_6211 [Trichophyton rubrum]
MEDQGQTGRQEARNKRCEADRTAPGSPVRRNSRLCHVLRAHEAAGQKLQGQRKKQPRCLELTKWRDESMSDLSPSTTPSHLLNPSTAPRPGRRLFPSFPTNADEPPRPAASTVVCGL